MEMLDDAELAMLAKSDPAAMAALLERYKPLIVSKCSAPTREESEEIEAWMKGEMVRAIRKYKPHPRVRFAGFAKSCAMRIRVDYARTGRRKRIAAAELSDDLDESPTVQISPEMAITLDLVTRELNELELRAVAQIFGEKGLRVSKHVVSQVRAFLQARLTGVSTDVILQLFDTVPAPAPGSINTGLSPANPRTLGRLLGEPRNSYTKDCLPISNKSLAARMLYGHDVGPFKVAGERLAIQSLKEVLADIKKYDPEIYKVLGSAGMLCCRLVRGSTSSISNHSWGTAIDLKIDGRLDVRGDARVQRGLLSIYKHFHKHGWFWGAEFRTEDAMHFELSDQKIMQLYGGR